MSKFIKRFLSLFMVIVMVLTVAPLSGFVFSFAGNTDINEASTDQLSKFYNVGDEIQFGSYPQSKVTDEDLIDKLINCIEDDDWISYGYYTGTGSCNDGNMVPSNYMKYVDINYNNEKYRAVYFTSYRPCFTGYSATSVSLDYSQQDENGYYINNIYFFKYEPLIWKLLNPKTGYVMCAKSIDSQAYQNFVYYNNDNYYNDTNCEVYATDWATSSLRSWLNNEFYNIAFTDEEQSQIITTTNNNYSRDSSINNCTKTNDKVFLLSYEDTLKSEYGFKTDDSTNDTSKQIKSTDYAQCQGCYKDLNSGNSFYWLRTSYNTIYTSEVATVGCSCNGYYANYTDKSIVPALCLKSAISPIDNSIQLEKDKQYSDSDFIQYGSPQFYDSQFDYSLNGIEAYNNAWNGNVSVTKIDADTSCPTTSNYMLKITSKDGEISPGLGGFHQIVNGVAGKTYYHAFIAKIPIGYSVSPQSNSLGYCGSIKMLTDSAGTGDWKLYVYKIDYGAIFDTAPYGYGCGFVALEKTDENVSDNVIWYLGYSNIFNSMDGISYYTDSEFLTSDNNISRYNNNYTNCDNVSVSRISASEDCPNTSGYMVQIQTSSGTSFPGYGGFYQKINAEAGKTYYHKFVAKIPVGYEVDYKAELIDGDFEWLTDNKGTGKWKTYIYKLKVDNNATKLGSFGYIALYPDDFDSGNEYSTGYIEKQNIENNLTIVWCLAYSNIFDTYEFDSDFKATDLKKGAYTTYNSNFYVRYDYPVSWHTAKLLCERMGGHLVTITSEEEKNAVNSLYSSFSTIPYYLFGATDEQTEGTWKWITNETFSYTNWSSGQPDDYKNGQDYAIIDSLNGTWDDCSANDMGRIGFVCEFEDNYVPVKTVEKDGHLYSLYNNFITWTEAEQYCEAIGGHLVTINSQDENTIVQELLQYSCCPNNDSWIGASDANEEGVWRWIDSGEIFLEKEADKEYGFNNWGQYHYSYSENYCEIQSDGTWNDISNDDFNSFVCEVDTTNIKCDFYYYCGGSKYEVYDKSLSWTDAEKYAEIQGGHLATITSQQEENFITSIIQGHSKSFYWLGARKNTEAITNRFQWVTKEKWFYSNFAKNEPNNVFEMYNQIYASNSADGSFSVGEWNDQWNNFQSDNDYYNLKNGFIVEYDNYYTTVTYDENNGKPINYFIAPTVEDDWNENSDGTLSTDNGEVYITYDPSDETFTFDTKGEKIINTSLSNGYIFYSFSLPFQVKENQYITLSSYCVSGTKEQDNATMVLEINRGQLSSRDYLDIYDGNGTCSNYSKTGCCGPFTSENASYATQCELWLSVNTTTGYVKYDNYKVRLSVNYTDNQLNEFQYSTIAQNINSSDTYVEKSLIPTKQYCDFVGWTYNGKSISSDTMLYSQQNHTLTADWNLHPYSLAFNANGGICNTSNKTIYYGKTFGELPVPTKDGYLFVGWYTKKKGGTQIKSDSVSNFSADTTVYACWAKAENNKCGDNISWCVDGNKLIISGTGDMYDCTSGNAPWYSINNYITSIEIQSGITGIGDYSFYGLTNVQSIMLSDTITDIGKGAFEFCTSIKNFSFPNNIKIINEDSFKNCTGFTEIEIPYSINEIKDGAFDNCNNIIKIIIQNPKCLISDEMYISNENLTIYGYTNSTAEKFASNNEINFVAIGTYGVYENIVWIFTDSTKTLEIIASGKMPNFKENVIPWNVVKSDIKNVVFHDDITYIGDNTLDGCANVVNITLPKNLQNVGKTVFEDTPWFKNNTSDVIYINAIMYAYSSSASVDDIVLGNGISAISGNFSSTFISGNKSPESMQIASTVTSIADGALAYAKNLKTLTVNAGNKNYKSISNVLYSKDGKNLICYPAGLDGTIKIPSTVTTINDYAFAGCSSLKRLYLDKNIISIGDKAFDSTSLTTIYGYKNSYAEEYANENGYMFVPYTSKVTFDCNDGTMNTYGDNLFNYNEYISSIIDLDVCGNGKLTYDFAEQSLTVISQKGYSAYDVFTDYSGYEMAVEPNTTYILEFDISTSGDEDGISPVYIFTDFDTDSPSNGDSRSDDSTDSYRMVFGRSFIFTTGAEAKTLKIRFGNRSYGDYSSTFSNIQIRKVEDNISESKISVRTGSAIGELPIPKNEGYIFTGWYYEADGEDIKVDSDFIVNEDLTLYAYWEKIEKADAYITGISIKTIPSKLEYFVGDALDTTGLKVVVNYSDGTQIEANKNIYCTPTKLNSSGTQKITVLYAGFTTEYNVTVNAIVPTSMSITTLPNTTKYYINQYLEPKGMLVTVLYNNGTQKVIKDTSQFEYIYDFSEESSSSDVVLNYTENGKQISTKYQVSVNKSPTIYSEDLSFSAGDSINIPIYIKDNIGIMGYDIILTYDPTVMKLDGAASSKVNGSIVSNDENGTVKIIWYSTDEVTTGGILFTIPFVALNKAPTGDYDILISYIEDDTFDGEFDNVKLNCENSTIHIDAVEAGPTLYSDNIQGYSGGYIDIPVYFSKNCGIEDASYLTMNYNKEMFTFESYTNAEGTVTKVSDSSNGKKFRFDELGTDVENGTLVTLRFKVNNSASGEYSFTMSIDDDKWSTESFVVKIQKVNTITYIKADNITATPGDTIIIPVKISGNTGIMGYNIKFTYDENNLTFINAEPSSTWAGNFEYNAQDGVVNTVWNSSKNIIDDGDIIYLTFKVNENSNPGAYNILVRYVQTNTYNENWQNVNLSCQPISIIVSRKQFVKSANNSSSNVCNDERIICGLKPNLNDLSEYIEAEIGYTYSVEKSSSKVGTGSKVNIFKNDEIIDTYNVVIYGDVNGDGWYDGQDSLIVQCIMYGMLTKEQVGDAVWEAADCNHDNVIDQSDVDMLNQAGLLLANVDQSKTSEEMLEVSSNYMDYLSLISQNETDITDDESVTDADSSDDKNQYEDIVKSDRTIAIDLIRKIFLSIIEFLKKYLVLG